MEKILEQYFVQNNELVLTNIGTIHLTKKPATWIGDTLHAPEQSILFTLVPFIQMKRWKNKNLFHGLG